MRSTTPRAILLGVFTFAAFELVHAAPVIARPTPAQATASPQSSDPTVTSTYRALLDQYCITCHNERLRVANLVLDKNTIDLDRAGNAAAVLEKVLQKVRTGAMPPAGRPRPDSQAVEAFTVWLERSLDRAAEAAPNPGRPTIHRLNRTEYTNAVRDMLEIGRAHV